LREFLEPSLDTENNDDLPDTVDIDEADIRHYLDLWVEHQADDKKFLPAAGGLLDQPVRAMHVIHRLDSLAERVVRQLKNERKPEATGS